MNPKTAARVTATQAVVDRKRTLEASNAAAAGSGMGGLRGVTNEVPSSSRVTAPIGDLSHSYLKSGSEAG